MFWLILLFSSDISHSELMQTKAACEQAIIEAKESVRNSSFKLLSAKCEKNEENYERKGEAE